MVDKDIESKSGAQSKADTAESNAESYADSEIESHRSNEVHDQQQPPKSHGNAAHSSTFAVDGDTQPPAQHGNTAHSSNYVDSSGAADAAPVQTVNGQQGDVSVEFTSSLTTEGVIGGEAPDAIGIEAAVQLFIDDKVPRGEAFLDFLLSYEDTAEAITRSGAFMFVINNEGKFSNRESNPTPENFNPALTLLDDPAARLVAYIELFLADYTQGQDDLDTLLDSPPAARQLGDSRQAQRVINDGDDRPDLQDYRV